MYKLKHDCFIYSENDFKLADMQGIEEGELGLFLTPVLTLWGGAHYDGYISSGVSHSDGSCVSGRIHSDVSLNIQKKVYHIVTDYFVNL